MKWLTVPEDDATPYTPFEIVLQSNFEAFDSDMTPGADALGLCQFLGAFGEEELVAPFTATSTFFL